MKLLFYCLYSGSAFEYSTLSCPYDQNQEPKERADSHLWMLSSYLHRDDVEISQVGVSPRVPTGLFV